MSKFISTSEARFQNQDASIKNLETQVGQLAKMMFERAQGTLPSNTEPNSRGQINSIFLGSIEEASNEKQPTTERTIEEHKPKILDPKRKADDQKQEEIEQLIDT